ncbi:hypothetical protein H206_06971 [Candidatus Electrothrix aarhusensis]|uniref:Uncharacterized protein n=1 Tax=Candidatus Electrothrix aarhusensis TaxID=1859131 RepID=A0A3S3SQE0_9BACT|nr:hypothetical protein H206_06971 [Candidatus Electrothrix aarhusensis]
MGMRGSWPYFQSNIKNDIFCRKSFLFCQGGLMCENTIIILIII